MVVSNQNIVKRSGLFLLFLMIVDLAVLTIHWWFFRKPDWLFLILLVLLVALLIIIYFTEYTEFENSGFIIYVRRKHFLSGTGEVVRLYEFPIVLLQEWKKKGYTILLKVNSNNSIASRTYIFKIDINSFGEKQQYLIQSSLADSLKAALTKYNADTPLSTFEKNEKD